MRHLRYLVGGLLAGALLGGLLGAFALRPSDGDLAAWSRALVPPGFTVTYEGVAGRAFDPIGGGYTELAASSPKPYAAGTVDLAALARANGWRITHDREMANGHETWIERWGVTGGIETGGRSDGAGFSVSVRRTQPVLPILVGALVGACVAAALGFGLSSLKRRPLP